MRFKLIWLVFLKELRSSSRDRRTLISSIIMPLIMIPLFTLGFPVLFGKASQGEAEARQKVGVVGLAHMPADLKMLLEQDKKQGDKVLFSGVELVPTQNPIEAVQKGELDAALSVPENLPTEAGNTPVAIQVFIKETSLKSMGVKSKLETAINAYRDSLVEKRLTAAGLGKQVLTPVIAQTVDASTKAEQNSGQLAFIIPMFILQFILAGAQPTAIDSTAGEKERGTFEALLVSPVRRLEVVVGKLAAVTSFSLLSAMCSVMGLLLSGVVAKTLLPSLLGERSESVSKTFGGSLSLDLTSTLQLIAVAVTVGLLVSVIVLMISVYARNFKEAQTYLVPFSLLVVIPVIGLQFADFLKAGVGLYATPLIGSMLSIMDVVKGAAHPQMVLVTCLSSLLFATLCVLLTLRSFNREEVIFRN